MLRYVQRQQCNSSIRTATALAVRLLPVALLLFHGGCSAAPAPTPTPTRPLRACFIDCPGGYFNRTLHVCRSGRRQFQDFLIKGEYVVRNVDGTKKYDRWVGTVDTRYGTLEEERDKVDVVLMDCDTYVRGQVLARDPDMRGLHPGEKDYSKKPDW